MATTARLIVTRYLSCAGVFVRPAVLLLACIFLNAPASLAQGVQWGQVPAADADLDLSVPESPAFTLLGLTPQSVVRPATPRELATSLLNGFDENGNFQTGLALELQPYMLLAGDTFTIQDYRDASAWTRILVNSQISLAATKGTSDDDEATRVSGGVRLSLYNRGDPRRDLETDQCFRENLKPPQMVDYPGNPQAWQAAFKAYATSGGPADAEKCRAAARERHWNASAWDVAAAGSMVDPSTDGASDSDLEFGGAAFWTSAAYGFEEFEGFRDTSQIIVHARYAIDQEVPDPSNNDVFEEKDEFLAGVRGRFGRPDLNVSIEADYVNQDRDSSGSDSSFRGSIGTEFRVTDNVWVKFAVGATSGQEDDQKVFVFLQLDWGGFSIDPGEIYQKITTPAPPPPA